MCICTNGGQNSYGNKAGTRKTRTESRKVKSAHSLQLIGGGAGVCMAKKLQIARACGVWTERTGTAGYGRIPMGWRQ